jgi:hypothetical protein
MDINDSIKIYNCDTLKEDLLFNRNIIQQGDVDHGLVSPTARYILIPIRKEKEKVIKKFSQKENSLFIRLDASILYRISI